MKTLVAILGHQGANATILRHWPFYERSGRDLAGVGRVDKPVSWPQTSSFIGSFNIGQDGGAGGPNHLERLLNLYKLFLTDLSGLGYTDICVIEYDGIFLRPLPDHPGGLATTVGGYGDGVGFAPCPYFHTPWWVDVETAGAIVEYGERMLGMKIYEGGFVDRWLGLMVELYKLPWNSFPSFSVNSLDHPVYMKAARDAIARGAAYVHGVKTEQQLRELISPFRA
jgi:hypothetical protein